MANKDDIGEAYRIAKALDDQDFDVQSAGCVLAMALGILAAGTPGAHRNLRPLVEAQLEAAQMAFDAIRAGGDPN